MWGMMCNKLNHCYQITCSFSKAMLEHSLFKKHLSAYCTAKLKVSQFINPKWLYNLLNINHIWIINIAVL